MKRLSVTLGAARPDCKVLQAEDPTVMRVNALQSSDPTHTLTLRTEFARDMAARFGRVRSDIRTSILHTADDGHDCFGIEEAVPQVAAAMAIDRIKAYVALQAVFSYASSTPEQRRTLELNVPAAPRQFDFATTAEKVDAFMAWLEEQERNEIIEITYRPGTRRGLYEAWTDVYVQSAYARGVVRGRAELRRAGYDVQSVADTPGGVANIMNQPFHADRVGALYTRVFEDLKTVQSQMNAAIRRQVAEGLTVGLSRGVAEGKNPRVIARELYKDVEHHLDKIGVTRARVIARTEVIRAHHIATIYEYRQADAEMMVGVQAEWSTAGDHRVCQYCAGLEGQQFTLNEIEDKIPAHPNCRCVALPIIVHKEGRQ